MGGNPSKDQVNHVVREKQKTKYAFIGDDYHSLEQVTQALANAGLESSNLIVGIDFTKSNEWAGKISFNGWSLHDMVHSPNPYEQTISILGRTLSSFDEDDLIPCFGFGDASTHDRDVFSFNPNEQPCHGFEEALKRYRELVPSLHLYGPTSFAPIIETAISIVDNSGGQYHVLLIIADGQVSCSLDGSLSRQEKETINAIVRASEHPLSIVVVGVGDGPWDMMKKFDDSIPSRAFDNFQFVNFTEIMSRKTSSTKKETDFALSALMEIPEQYKATIALQLLGKRRGILKRQCLTPPVGISSSQTLAHSTSSAHSHTTPQASPNDKTCSVCALRPKNLTLGCGHQTCLKCGEQEHFCPVCQLPIQMKINLN